MPVMCKKSKKYIAIYFLAAVVLIVLDQFTKYLASAYLKGREAAVLISGVFELSYLENQSAAFGIDPVSILQNIFHFTYFEVHPEAFLLCKMVFFAILTIIVVFLILLLFCRIPETKRFLGMNVTLTLFVAGAIGNFIDRMSHHYVVDFLYFSLINFPIFNVADIYVTCAAALMLILCMFYYKEDDFNAVFPPRKRQEES